ncbi:hypothetical protein EJ08DRAFT_492947 [Tothia fuscella]|uniref:Uncharacterized protein n=1 Tax=Tothia fuscella TaxID=1048955 RepID=A0A9P4NHP4_9PEZI|nr:hypothetical protein EJ08DRAFT_492947 [Tothia fuscella]
MDWKARHPTVKIRLNGGAAAKLKTVTCTIFTTAIESPKDIKMLSQAQGDDKDIIENLPQEATNLYAMYDKKVLRETRITLKDDNDLVLFANLSAEEKKAISRKLPMGGNAAELPRDGDGLLAALMQAKHISLYTLFYDQVWKTDPLDRFRDYFMTCTRLCIEYGTWWYYRIWYQELVAQDPDAKQVAIDKCLKYIDTKLDSIPPPR